VIQRFVDAGWVSEHRAEVVLTDCRWYLDGGSGVAAFRNLPAMEQAGLGRGRLFPGSWSEWSRDPDRPAQTGAGPES
jgi:thiosulfate/3-mercaptopyruvate sulfurtransferase